MLPHGNEVPPFIEVDGEVLPNFDSASNRHTIRNRTTDPELMPHDFGIKAMYEQIVAVDPVDEGELDFDDQLELSPHRDYIDPRFYIPNRARRDGLERVAKIRELLDRN